MKRLILLAIALTTTLAHTPKRYDGFEVYRILPKTVTQLNAFRELERSVVGYDFWKGPSGIGRNVDLMVPPDLKYDFRNFTWRYNLESKLWIEDVQEKIDNIQSQTTKAAADYDWKSYQTLDDLYDWMDSLVLKYPKIVTPIVGGKSYQGREIRGVRLSFGPDKKAVFIEGGIHAREWISPATVTFILNQLLSSEDAIVRGAAESRDWYIFPSVNPDGYVYTHREDRMWRRTRKPFGTTCVGADPNRNWDYHWMEGGASTSPCSETHGGNAPFSEIETRTLSEFISSIADQIDIYLSFHSYSQLILIPFGHAGLEVPENNEELHRIAWAAAEALMQKHGTNYTVGNIPEAIYVASGGSIDWVLGKHRNIRVVYAYELRDKGEHGFLLPVEQIIPTGEETLDSVVKIVEEVGIPDKEAGGDGASTLINVAIVPVTILYILKLIF